MSDGIPDHIDDDYEVRDAQNILREASISHKIKMLAKERSKQIARHAKELMSPIASMVIGSRSFESPEQSRAETSAAREDGRRQDFVRKQQLGPFFELWKWITGIWPLVKGLFKLLMWIFIIVTVSYTVSVFRETCSYWIRSLGGFIVEMVRTFAENLPSPPSNLGATHIPPPAPHKVSHP
jgi:hypothetical protein